MTAANTSSNATPASSETVLLLSFAQRDSLADQLSRLGFRVVAARRAEGIVRRFAGLDSALVVLDARGAFDQALVAAEMLSDSVAAKKANILLLYDRMDATRVHAFADSGITAMLPSPWHDAELALAIGLARRQAIRFVQPSILARQMWWHSDITNGIVTVDRASDAVIRTALLGDGTTLRDALSNFTAPDRKCAIAAYRKLRSDGGYTAFSQSPKSATVAGRFIHHLVMTGNALAGHVEWLGDDLRRGGAATSNDSLGLTPFPSALSQCRASLRGSSLTPAIALIQIDGLDGHSDSMGPAATETLVRNFAKHLDRTVRQELGHSAQLAFVATNRFAIIAAEPGLAGRLALEMRLMAASLAESLLVPAHSGLSLRIANSNMRSDDSVDSVLARLSRRLTVPQAVIDQLNVKLALSSDQVIVRFQPQFDLGNDRMIGAEALARWQHPKLGELGGGALFTAAQASAMTHEVSQHVWNMALQSMAAWPTSMAKLRVALNITAHDMADPTLAVTLLQLASRHGVTPDRLAVEVTESAMIAQPDQAAANLSALRHAGVKVALDDFGTGYSGLAWLKQLPVDTIKIDSGFARAAHGSERDAAVLRGVIDLAGGLGMGVLAEGVESVEQRDQLRAMGCRWYQGFLKAPALDSGDFIAFVAAN